MNIFYDKVISENFGNIQKEENEKIMSVTKEQVAHAADGIAPDTVFFMYGDGEEEEDEG